MVLEISRLTVRLPGGEPILNNISLDVRAGEAVVIVGPSGAGKSTLLRALFEKPEMIEEGFAVEHDGVEASGSLGLVPQRGAVFDHLDVAGNLSLAISRADGATDDRDPAYWLRAMELDEDWAIKSRSVAHLSGGQAQRLAVARTLASGRRVLFLDEPSVGLDPLRVRTLARQLRRMCDDEKVGIVVVTHDIHFAAEFSDRALLLRDGGLEPLQVAPRTGAGCRSGTELAAARTDLEGRMLAAFVVEPGEGSTSETHSDPINALRRSIALHLRPFGVLVQSAASAVRQAVRRPKEFAQVASLALRQSLLRPILFYAIVAFLLGFTILYVLTTVGGDVGPGASIRVIRGMYILALTPPVSAFLFVAASANAVNAWIGGMRLSRQVTALEALGISRVDYLWGPAWAALVVAYLIIAAVFAIGLLLGGLVLCSVQGIDGAWDLIVSDLLDPVPERAPYRVRAILLVLIYAIGCASDAIARSDERKERADDVTKAMTRSVVASTLWVVALELISVYLVRASS